MSEPAGPPRATLRVGWRSGYDAPPPRRIRLEIPGWAGSSGAHGDGAPAQPWHCRPFVEGATYGLELVYPYARECRVRNVDGRLEFSGGIQEEFAAAQLPLPFGVFAAGHYGMATALDLLPPEGHALRLGPHPRYFTESGDDVPLALPGHLQPASWPRQFFAVFRAPPPGGVHVFRPGEPYAQLLVVPVEAAYAVTPMPDEEAAERARQEAQVVRLDYMLARRIWRSDAGVWFNDKYKQLLRLARREGPAAVPKRLQSLEDEIARRAARRRKPDAP